MITEQQRLYDKPSSKTLGDLFDKWREGDGKVVMDQLPKIEPKIVNFGVEDLEVPFLLTNWMRRAFEAGASLGAQQAIQTTRERIIHWIDLAHPIIDQ